MFLLEFSLFFDSLFYVYLDIFVIPFYFNILFELVFFFFEFFLSVHFLLDFFCLLFYSIIPFYTLFFTFSFHNFLRTLLFHLNFSTYTFLHFFSFFFNFCFLFSIHLLIIFLLASEFSSIFHIRILIELTLELIKVKKLLIWWIIRYVYVKSNFSDFVENII